MSTNIFTSIDACLNSATATTQAVLAKALSLEHHIQIATARVALQEYYAAHPSTHMIYIVTGVRAPIEDEKRSSKPSSSPALQIILCRHPELPNLLSTFQTVCSVQPHAILASYVDVTSPQSVTAALHMAQTQLTAQFVADITNVPVSNAQPLSDTQYRSVVTPNITRNANPFSAFTRRVASGPPVKQESSNSVLSLMSNSFEDAKPVKSNSAVADITASPAAAAAGGGGSMIQRKSTLQFGSTPTVKAAAANNSISLFDDDDDAAWADAAAMKKKGGRNSSIKSFAKARQPSQQHSQMADTDNSTQNVTPKPSSSASSLFAADLEDDTPPSRVTKNRATVVMHDDDDDDDDGKKNNPKAIDDDSSDDDFARKTKIGTKQQNTAKLFDASESDDETDAALMRRRGGSLRSSQQIRNGVVYTAHSSCGTLSTEEYDAMMAQNAAEEAEFDKQQQQQTKKQPKQQQLIKTSSSTTPLSKDDIIAKDPNLRINPTTGRSEKRFFKTVSQTSLDADGFEVTTSKQEEEWREFDVPTPKSVAPTPTPAAAATTTAPASEPKATTAASKKKAAAAAAPSTNKNIMSFFAKNK